MSEKLNGPCVNTDRELWREPPGDYYANSIHVTERGGIGIDVGGHVIVRSLRGWHEAAKELAAAEERGRRRGVEGLRKCTEQLADPASEPWSSLREKLKDVPMDVAGPIDGNATEMHVRELMVLLAGASAVAADPFRRALAPRDSAPGEPVKVFSRDECPFNYCDQEPPWTACLGRCRHEPRDSGKENSK